MNRRSFRAVSAAAAGAVLAAMLTGCGNSSAPASTTAPESTTSAVSETTVSAEPLPDGTILNFIPPEIGEEIAVITVKDYGVIKIKLFPEACPLGVENFKGLIGMNYYDDTTFHRIKPDFMIQGGDPQGTGKGGQSMWGGYFDGGISEGLYHFTGAVAYANGRGPSTDGSQFYIVNSPEGFLPYTFEEMQQADPEKYNWPQNVMDVYKEKGGIPYLDPNYTVFGQVIEGMDVVYAITDVEVDPSNDMPLTPVQVETIRLEKYQGE